MLTAAEGSIAEGACGVLKELKKGCRSRLPEQLRDALR